MISILLFNRAFFDRTRAHEFRALRSSSNNESSSTFSSSLTSSSSTSSRDDDHDRNNNNNRTTTEREQIYVAELDQTQLLIHKKQSELESTLRLFEQKRGDLLAPEQTPAKTRFERKPRRQLSGTRARSRRVFFYSTRACD
jgi:hypothetical protein